MAYHRDLIIRLSRRRIWQQQMPPPRLPVPMLFWLLSR
jgi:hypothetical protein